MLEYIFLFCVVMSIASVIFNFQFYKKVMNEGKDISLSYHIVNILIMFGFVLVSDIIFANIIFTVDSSFVLLSYKTTFVLTIIFDILTFFFALFYISAVDEFINHKVNHEKTSFKNKFKVLVNQYYQ